MLDALLRLKPARPSDLAVITGAGFVIPVVPPVLATGDLTVVSLCGEAAVDQKVRKLRTHPSAPTKRMPRIPERHPSILAPISNRFRIFH